MDPIQFLDILDSSLTESELSAVCRQFSLTFDAFPGATKRDRARAFVGYMARQGRMAGLAEATVALRPDLTAAVAALFAAEDEQLEWLDRMSSPAGDTAQSGVTWRWPESGKSGSAPASESGADPTDATVEPKFDSASATVAEPVTRPFLQTAPPAAQPAAGLPPNPYTPGRAVTDDGMFFGRAAELEWLRARLAAREHVAIVGPRTLGGSSLLHRLARAPGDDGRPLAATIDARDLSAHTLPGLLNSIWAQWWTLVKPAPAAKSEDTVLVTNLAEFVTAVRKLAAAGFRPLVFLDHLEQLIWRPAVFNDALYDAWHELGRNGEMGLAVTSHTPPADLLAQAGFQTRFYELFQRLDLGLMDSAAGREMLTVPAQRAGLAVPDGETDALLELAGPHPFFLQLLGLYLYDALARGDYARAAVTASFEAAATPYWQELWDGLTPVAQYHFPAAAMRVTGGMAERQMRLLANRGLVIADGYGFRPFSAGFARWLRRVRAAVEAAAMAGATPV